ncbi:aspartate aminotransferase family protein [Paeniglutamicibacter sp. ABSL32-1]|uniref:pyridoxal phosphate-dependent decarboxylase family protein n=1 Tax=Paeniglutamicibacter quisquiliarum TaxID=2849498 RepID=UPI001C2CF6D2|nr:aspartate aminotransferase family protein [Paeniglutamicibacter quisquiliarum]MBV1779794.1 aspartate aminotransferase family protein [Paeniglutamicibacter quisquiliarum]
MTPQRPLAQTLSTPTRFLPVAADQLLGSDTADRMAEEFGAAARLAARSIAAAAGPTTGPGPDALRARLDAVDLRTPLGTTEAALEEATELYLRDAVYFHHPRYAAHLNCPVALPAIAAEALVTTVNTSMDTWDQSAGATLIEQRLIDWAADLAGLGPDADGVFTSGGTASNLQAMLLARNTAVAGKPGSLPERLAGLRIYASADSHFSISTSASLLGLGAEAVVAIECDALHRMDAAALRRALEKDRAAGLRAMAIVATAGTTDFGSIDPLPAIGELAAAHGAWFHVDAAYGCGLLGSPRHRGLLAGIEAANSVTVDFHKSFFQPIGSSAIVVRDRTALGLVSHHAEYLNPAAEAGRTPNQVDKSLATTRRFDALKLWVTLRSMGAEALGSMFDSVMDLAAAAGRLVDEHPELELAAEVQLSTVVFRYVPPVPVEAGHAPLANEIRSALYDSGEAMVAATTIAGVRHLKLTLLNPQTSIEDVAAILAAVVGHGRRIAGERALAGVQA